jgi:hypothetical protein
MAKENKEGVGDPIKLLLRDALVKQRNETMDQFAQILQQILTIACAFYLIT